MKNIFVLIIILSFSGVAFAQNFRPAQGNQQGKMLKHEQFLDIQLLDSFVGWQWDTLLLGWTPTLKITSFQYDGDNNITGFVRQQWNGTVWVDADNFIYA